MRPIIWTSRPAAAFAALAVSWLASIELGTSRTASRAAADAGRSDEIVVDTSTGQVFDAAAAVAMPSAIAASLAVGRASFKWQRSAFVAGVVLLLGSGALSTVARRHLGRFHRDSLTVHADHSLVDTGPYAVVRHPLYVATIGVLAGFGVVLGNRLSLMLSLLPTAAVIRRIAVEEEMLVEALGSEYVKYQENTARLIPGVW